MKKDWKYILYLTIFVGVYVSIQLLSPKSHNWSITLSHVDKNPYGTYVLNELLPDLFHEIEVSNTTFYELLNDDKANFSVISFATRMNLSAEDTEALMTHVARGNDAFLSAHYFFGKLADTLNLLTTDYLFDNSEVIGQQDSMELYFSNPTLDASTQYLYKRDNAHNYFKSYDTTRTHIITRNDLDEPVTLRVRIGKGNLFLNSTPLAFSNINMLNRENNSFASTCLSHLNNANVRWTEYYHLGRMEASTPLRFVLTQEPLAWAYYVTMASLFLFILFEIKRKQRIIPIITPLANTTLEFVSTISNLYYQRGDHKNIAEKKIAFFFDQLKTKYFIDQHYLTTHDINFIAAKTGNDIVDTGILFKTIESIQSKSWIASDELIKLNKLIEQFVK